MLSMYLKRNQRGFAILSHYGAFTMETVYACTHVTKEVSTWHPTEGASFRRTCTMDESCNTTASTLASLIRNIGERYFLDLEDLFLPGEEDEPVDWFDFNRVETNDCDVPSEEEEAEWERGELKLYLCDYSFHIEKRIVAPIDRSEFALAHIKTH